MKAQARKELITQYRGGPIRRWTSKIDHEATLRMRVDTSVLRRICRPRMPDLQRELRRVLQHSKADAQAVYEYAAERSRQMTKRNRGAIWNVPLNQGETRTGRLEFGVSTYLEWCVHLGNARETLQGYSKEKS
ncbi:hypothetical protein ACFV5N_02270 [Streptomyces sp. NPDC059853]|uniref:hypothetical protein n=1 Tax=Streptomyces sp. NPDC059853 TaxID=3346973 RepID=UPI003660AA1B